jgi:hypothetical protein
MSSLLVLPVLSAAFLFLASVMILMLARQDASVWPKDARLLTICAATRKADTTPRRAFVIVVTVFVALFLATTALQVAAAVAFLNRCKATTFQQEVPSAAIVIQIILFIGSVLISCGLLGIAWVPFEGARARKHLAFAFLFFAAVLAWCGLANATGFFWADVFRSDHDAQDWAIARLSACVIVSGSACVIGVSLVLERLALKRSTSLSETASLDAAAGKKNELATAWLVAALGEYVFGAGFFISLVTCEQEIMLYDRPCPPPLS